MLSDYVNCTNCDAIFDFESESGKQCDGCESVYCDTCINAEKPIELFLFRSSMRCTGCFETEPKKPTSWNLLDFLLEKYNLSHKDVLDDFLKTAPAWYTVPPDAYVCTKCPNNECASKFCEYVSKNYIIPGTENTYRGFCCMAIGIELCLGCQKWEAKRTCVAMIGVRKFRKKSLLNTLPRDVLIHCILKPWIKGKRVGIVEGGQKKKLKL